MNIMLPFWDVIFTVKKHCYEMQLTAGLLQIFLVGAFKCLWEPPMFDNLLEGVLQNSEHDSA